ncbi:hypothetical protein ACMA5M_15565, partial [Citrobacter farmeri]|uniref:hypothetical protein n=1 Tax=Citrobacter farmeri TaxID=67824 RepID=UPI0039BC5D8F
IRILCSYFSPFGIYSVRVPVIAGCLTSKNGKKKFPLQLMLRHFCHVYNKKAQCQTLKEISFDVFLNSFMCSTRKLTFGG